MQVLPKEITIPILAFAVDVPPAHLGVSSFPHPTTSMSEKLEPLWETVQHPGSSQIQTVINVALHLSLVCKDWYRLTVPEIYRHLIIDVRKESKIDALLETIETNKDLAEQVQTITIGCSSNVHRSNNRDFLVYDGISKRQATVVFRKVKRVLAASKALTAILTQYGREFAFSTNSTSLDGAFLGTSERLRQFHYKPLWDRIGLGFLAAILPELRSLDDLQLGILSQDNLDDRSATTAIQLPYRLSSIWIEQFYAPDHVQQDVVRWLLGQSTSVTKVGTNDSRILKHLLSFQSTILQAGFNPLATFFPASARLKCLLEGCSRLKRVVLSTGHIDPSYALDLLATAYLPMMEEIVLHQIGTRDWSRVLGWVEHYQQSLSKKLPSLKKVYGISRTTNPSESLSLSATWCDNGIECGKAIVLTKFHLFS